MANPAWINTVPLDDITLRHVDLMTTMASGTPLAGRSGVRPGSGAFTVSLAGSTITVGAGVGTVYQASQGVYRAALTSAATLTLTAAHATLARVDLVYLRVWDNAVDGSGLSKAEPVYLAGTASSTPVAPTPAGTQIYVPLATISVPASGGGSPSVSQTVMPYTVAPGGILPDATVAGLYTGQYRDNGTALQRWTGSTWETYQKAETIAWTNITTFSSGFSAVGNGGGTPQCRIISEKGTNWLELSGSISMPGNLPTDFSPVQICTLPSGFGPGVRRGATLIKGGVGGSTTFRIDINTDRTIVAYHINETASASTNWCFLDEVRVRTDSA